MERISLHIEYLLLRHDCVVVPGLGAFIMVHHNARYDSRSGRYLPPMREVRFNDHLQADDGLLTGSFARKYQISFAEAREQLRLATERLRSVLTDEGEVTFGRLGILHLTESAQQPIRFVALHTPEQLSAGLGYFPAFVKLTEATEKKTEVALNNLQTTAEEIGTQGRRFDTERNYYIAINKMFARTAACFVLAIGLALTVILPSLYFTDKPRQIKASSQIEQSTRIAAQEIADASEERVAEMIVAADQTESGEMMAEAETVSQPYCLIVATFRTEAEAERYIAANADSGYQLEAVSTPTLCRVAALRSSDRDTALRALNSAEFKSKFAEAWIWESKN